MKIKQIEALTERVSERRDERDKHADDKDAARNTELITTNARRFAPMLRLANSCASAGIPMRRPVDEDDYDGELGAYLATDDDATRGGWVTKYAWLRVPKSGPITEIIQGDEFGNMLAIDGDGNMRFVMRATCDMNTTGMSDVIADANRSKRTQHRLVAMFISHYNTLENSLASYVTRRLNGESVVIEKTPEITCADCAHFLSWDDVQGPDDFELDDPDDI